MNTKQQDIQAADQAVRTLIDFTNGYSSTELAGIILGRLQNEHRTLQQSFWSAVKIAVEAYADLPEYSFDLRNQDARQWAQEVKALTAAPAPRLPGRLARI